MRDLDDLPTYNEMRIAELESRIHILLMPIIEISKSNCQASVVASDCLKEYAIHVSSSMTEENFRIVK